jgi:cytoskeletal protein RodZ
MARLPWNRRKTTSTSAQVPEEVEQYYESTRKERVGIAWLLALVTLLLTILIAAGLFFAGRWAYRKIANNDNSSETTQQAGEESNEGAASGDSNGTTTPTADSPTTPSGSSDASAPTTTPQQTPTQTPVTGSTATDLPHTGPDVSD